VISPVELHPGLRGQKRLDQRQLRPSAFSVGPCSSIPAINGFAAVNFYAKRVPIIEATMKARLPGDV
jgi:hypothetical protein